MDRILNALQPMDWAELCEPKDFGLGPIHAVHDQDYIDFLACCWTEWQASDARDKTVLLPATFALRRHPQTP
jgi:acetoin utilization deacetylase AcuC-like enzyme